MSEFNLNECSILLISVLSHLDTNVLLMSVLSHLKTLMFYL